MKSYITVEIDARNPVTPCVGVWIEIGGMQDVDYVNIVTPCVGVWIEIRRHCRTVKKQMSHSLHGSVD